jgi:signal transduction histidine kinase
LNGSVTLSARALTKNGVPCFQISVKDTGIGMDAETLAKVFTPFVQANPAIASGFGGTGLGLTITRSLVEAMGGTLSVESGLGVGSNFTMTIPRHMI